MTIPEPLPEARILRLQEGDVLLFQVPNRLADDEVTKLLATLAEAFPNHGKVLIEDSMTVTVVRQGADHG